LENVYVGVDINGNPCNVGQMPFAIVIIGTPSFSTSPSLTPITTWEWDQLWRCLFSQRRLNLYSPFGHITVILHKQIQLLLLGCICSWV